MVRIGSFLKQNAQNLKSKVLITSFNYAENGSVKLYISKVDNFFCISTWKQFFDLPNIAILGDEYPCSIAKDSCFIWLAVENDILIMIV